MHLVEFASSEQLYTMDDSDEEFISTPTGTRSPSSRLSSASEAVPRGGCQQEHGHSIMVK